MAMALPKRVKRYLKENRIKYKITRHKEVFTTQEVAAIQHISGKQLAKVVVVKHKDFAMMVLPANLLLDIKKVKKILKSKSVRLAKEAELEKLFPDCEIGAMPPFGNLYNLPVYIDKSLTTKEKIAFEAGDHTHTIVMKYEELAQLIQPQIEEFGISPK
jgi:Ala-tRNA(Pro) deacylase